ncbi:MAG: 30S ribosomal protein S1 [Desulfobacterales bacterium]|jgi:small subunit ribosomal protein S1
MIDTQEPDVPEEESFADLLECYSSGMKDDLHIGDEIEGKIISIGKDTVFVDTGTKVDGAVDREELLDEAGEMPFSEGDVITLYVVGMDDSQIRLSKAISGVGGLSMLREAHDNRVPVDGKVSESCKGGYRVRLMQRTAFCPGSQIDIRPGTSPEVHIGQEYRFLVTQLDERGRNIVLSRRRLLEAERDAARKAILAEISEGDTVEGTVVKLMPYGAFVDIGSGVEGMVHISELSWSRIETPEAVCREGDHLSVKILTIEKDGKRISLSVKQATGDPWESLGDRFASGQTVSGTVTRLAPFGAFVEIAPGVEGLVHLSEMSYVKRVHKAEEVVSTGDAVSVVIKDVDIRSRRVSLSLRDTEGDPWRTVEEEFPLGKQVEGTIERRENFGLFVGLKPGVTGLLPRSKISASVDAQRLDRLKPGDTLTVVVDSVNLQDRKLSLNPAGESGTVDWRRHTEPESGGMGSLGDKLREALSDHQKKTP